MRLLIVCLTLFAIACPAIQAQGDKDKKDKKDKPDPKPEPKFIPLGQVAGKLEQSSESGLLKLRVPLRRIEPNLQAQANLIQQQPQWMRRQWEIMRNPNPYQRYQQMVQLVQEVERAKQNLFVVKETHLDLELQTADETKVRTTIPNPGFDDMGNIRALTREVLKELKGKENLPYFQAETTDLRNGQTVLIVAARERANKDKDAKPIATMVIILAEPKP